MITEERKVAATAFLTFCSTRWIKAAGNNCRALYQKRMKKHIYMIRVTKEPQCAESGAFTAKRDHNENWSPASLGHIKPRVNFYVYKSNDNISNTKDLKLSASVSETIWKNQHVTSFTRQLQIKYKYLADLITRWSQRTSDPRFIKESVLEILILEVDKLGKRRILMYSLI